MDGKGGKIRELTKKMEKGGEVNFCDGR